MGSRPASRSGLPLSGVACDVPPPRSPARTGPPRRRLGRGAPPQSVAACRAGHATRAAQARARSHPRGPTRGARPRRSAGTVSDLLLRLYHRLPAPARSAAATLRGLYLRMWRYSADTERLIEEALARERWTPERWRAWREERLAPPPARAAARVPYYPDALPARGGPRGRASPGVLRPLAILSEV